MSDNLTMDEVNEELRKPMSPLVFEQIPDSTTKDDSPTDIPFPQQKPTGNSELLDFDPLSEPVHVPHHDFSDMDAKNTARLELRETYDREFNEPRENEMDDLTPVNPTKAEDPVFGMGDTTAFRREATPPPSPPPSPVKASAPPLFEPPPSVPAPAPAKFEEYNVLSENRGVINTTPASDDRPVKMPKTTMASSGRTHTRQSGPGMTNCCTVYM